MIRKHIIVHKFVKINIRERIEDRAQKIGKALKNTWLLTSKSPAQAVDCFYV